MTPSCNVFALTFEATASCRKGAKSATESREHAHQLQNGSPKSIHLCKRFLKQLDAVAERLAAHRLGLP